MELSILKLEDPVSGRSVGERRRRIRHKLHSPAYASFNGPSAGMVLTLSELLDLSEDGFAVQASERLEVNRSISISIDLPETKSYIHGTGDVVWTDGAGRCGVRFSGLSDQSQRVLKQWLFVNLLLAGIRYASQSTQVSAIVDEKLLALTPAVEEVRREVRLVGDDFDAALRLITERALSLTEASGAALAFLDDDKMVCRGSTGEPALPLGTVVDVKQGITGECVLSGRMVVCEDVESDARVDGEICRMLGIGSILATPIFSDFRVVGVIEVFSPLPRAFSQVHEKALDRLAELVPKFKPAALSAQDATSAAKEMISSQELAPAIPVAQAFREAGWEPDEVVQEPLKGVPVRRNNILLLGLTLPILALVAGYLSAPKLAPVIDKFWRSNSSAVGPATAGAGTPVATRRISSLLTLSELRALANSGDAEAQWELGSRYRNGEGIPPDDTQAAKWFLLAAEQGHLGSQRAMGSYYWSGRGIPKDLTKAYFWSALAAEQGDEISASQMQGLVLQMTPAQVAAAQAQKDEWLRQRRAAK